MGESGFSAIGAVTGLTYPEEFERIRPLLPHTFLLIPGYGAQGGTGKDIAGFFKTEDKRPGMMRNIRNLYARAALTEQEVRSLRGMVASLTGTHIKRKMEREGKP